MACVSRCTVHDLYRRSSSAIRRIASSLTSTIDTNYRNDCPSFEVSAWVLSTTAGVLAVVESGAFFRVTLPRWRTGTYVDCSEALYFATTS